MKRTPEKYLKGIKAASIAASTCSSCDGEELWWMSNRDGPARRLEPGIYGLGNTLLDAAEVDWPKERFAAALRPPSSRCLPCWPNRRS